MTVAPSRTSVGQQFRHLLESLPVAAYTCDEHGLITYFNSEAERLWGRAPLINDPADRWCGSFRIFSAIDGSPIPHDGCWMALAIKTGIPQNGQELVIERPDGTRVLGLAHANPVHSDNGVLIGAVNVIVDIGDRRRGDVARGHLGAIVESSDDAIVSKTLEGRIVSWNQAAERMFGYTAEEAVGQSIMMIIPKERRDEEKVIIGQVTKGHRVEHYETVRLRKDGSTIDVSLSVSPIRDGAGRLIGASKIARDITAWRRTEESLRKLHWELRETDRARNEFLATLAHELRNPLAPIRNTVETLRRGDGTAPDLQESLAVMERQLGHMTRLIDDLLDVSRVSKNKLELRRAPVDLNDIITTALESSRPLLAARRHQFEADLSPVPVVMSADLVRMAQVLSNLLTNAAKYTEPGGVIRLTARREGEEAVVTVRDNGIGIPPDMLEKIFGMFAQVDLAANRSEGGLGIGLHLARRMAEMHGGTLVARSEGPGKGSAFELRVPIAAQGTTPRATEPPRTPIGRKSRLLRILVVDDNRDAVDSLGMLLGMPGHTVRVAYDGFLAIELAREFRPDVVLMDIGLPKQDGYETARKIREEPWGRAMTLIALTGWGQDEARMRSREAGYDLHLVKPVDPGLLLKQLEDLPVQG